MGGKILTLSTNFDPKFFLHRVERSVPPPDILYWRVRAVFVTFGNRKDAKTDSPLFRNKKMWNRAKNILVEIKNGYYSDPPGTEFYSHIIKDDGSIKTDKYGIKLLRSSHGTNSVENTHRQYSTTFRFRTGIEMADCLLEERRHRQNQNIACECFESYPDVGHFDTWLIDKLQNLLEHNHGKRLYDDWISASDFQKTPESFNMVALHSKELADALNEVKLQEGVKESYTDGMKYLCEAMGTKVPFLPVHGEKEYKLFATLVFESSGSFDGEGMALQWMKHVDGVEIFPKLPAHLRTHLQRHDHNLRVRRATREMKATVEQLRQLNNQELNPHHNHSDDDLPMPADNDDEMETPIEHTAPKRRRFSPVTPQVATRPPTLATLAPRPVHPPNTLPLSYFHTMNITGVSLSAPANSTVSLRAPANSNGQQRKPRTCKKCGNIEPLIALVQLAAGSIACGIQNE